MRQPVSNPVIRHFCGEFDMQEALLPVANFRGVGRGHERKGQSNHRRRSRRRSLLARGDRGRLQRRMSPVGPDMVGADLLRRLDGRHPAPCRRAGRPHHLLGRKEVSGVKRPGSIQDASSHVATVKDPVRTCCDPAWICGSDRSGLTEKCLRRAEWSHARCRRWRPRWPTWAESDADAEPGRAAFLDALIAAGASPGTRCGGRRSQGPGAPLSCLDNQGSRSWSI